MMVPMGGDYRDGTFGRTNPRVSPTALEPRFHVSNQVGFVALTSQLQLAKAVAPRAANKEIESWSWRILSSIGQYSAEDMGHGDEAPVHVFRKMQAIWKYTEAAVHMVS